MTCTIFAVSCLCCVAGVLQFNNYASISHPQSLLLRVLSSMLAAPNPYSRQQSTATEPLPQPEAVVSHIISFSTACTKC
jgi:VanZ family protein